MEEKQIKPITLKMENGDVFTLEFNRESVRYAEANGFDINKMDSQPMNILPLLFYFSFRKNHRRITKEKTDKILFEELGGLTPALIERLSQLYAVPFNTLMNDGETETKNSKVVVEM